MIARKRIAEEIQEDQKTTVVGGDGRKQSGKVVRLFTFVLLL